jgi:hypothetical protein
MWFYINELKEDKFMKKYVIMPSGWKDTTFIYIFTFSNVKI